MPGYEILSRGKAARQLEALPPPYFQLVYQHLIQLSDTPRPPLAKTLRGGVRWSLRAGVYRLLCDIDDQARQAVVYRVKHQHEACR